MIPYFYWDKLDLGLITIYSWGGMVALGIAVSLIVGLKIAKNFFIKENLIYDSLFWSLLSGILTSRLFYVFGYNWEYYHEHLREIFYLWQGGFSSVGWLAGGAVALYLFCLIKKISFYQLADIYSVAMPLGMGFGRLGCFFIHDHPGSKTGFWLGVQFPDGARHDLGLYLSIQGFILFIQW